MGHSLSIPASAPVMVLEGCNFFPGTPLPLHIFEMRYRAMLALALEGDRMFCLGTAVAGSGAAAGLPVDEEAGVFTCGTLGLVRACVQREDGTSNLILEGLQRVFFRGWLREKPFRIARLESLVTGIVDPQEVKRNAARVAALARVLIERGATRKPPEFDLGWAAEANPELMGDFVSNYLVTDLTDRHRLLAMGCLEERLGALGEMLKGQLGALGPDNWT